jgi:ABC-type transport system substrate-binding protein
MTKTRRQVIKAGAASALGLTMGGMFAACGDDDTKTSATGVPSVGATAAVATAAPKPGGDLTLTWSDLQKLDFQATISTPAQYASSLVFSRLVCYDPYSDANTYTIKPDLAEKWEQTENQITFHLRKGIKWQNTAPMNGRELTSADIKYSLQRVGSPGPDYVHAYKVDPIEQIDTPDDYTVVLHLKYPTAALITDLASGQGMGIVPREVIEADGDLNKRWVGTGPFMLDKWEKGSQIRFLKNPTYFKQGLPYLDSVTAQFIKDPSTALANFIAGRLDYYDAIQAEDIDRVKGANKAAIKTSPNLGGTHKVYNVGSSGPKETQDIRVRQAIDLAIDRGKLVSVALGDDGVWGGPFLPVGFGDWTLSEDEVKKLYAANVSEAKKLMSAAGVGNFTLAAEYSNIDTIAQAELPLMKQMLAEIGINLDLKPLERTIYLQAQVDSNFHFMAIGMGGYPDPNNFLEPVFMTGGSKNYGKASNADLDAAIIKQRGILDHNERVQFVQQMQRDWKKYLFRTYTVNQNVHQAWLPRVQGQFNPKGWDWKGLEAVSLA